MSENTYNNWIKKPKDRNAFAAWYTEANPILIIKIYRITGGDLPSAEDLLHDVIVQILDTVDVRKMVNESALHGYIVKAAKNRWMTNLSRNNRFSSLEETSFQDTTTEDTPINNLINEETANHIKTSLSAGEQQILRYMIDGKTLAEIAEAEKISYSNAGVKVHNIRNKINNL